MTGCKERGEKKVDRYMEALSTETKLLEGQGCCFSFTPGYQFQLTGYLRRDINANYVLRWVSHSLSPNHYANSFVAFPTEVPFRAPRVTPKPKMMSPLSSDGQPFYLRDLQSELGTWIHGLNIASTKAVVPLSKNDSFTAGTSTFRVRLTSFEVLPYLQTQSEPLLALIAVTRDERLLPWLTTSGERYQSLFQGVRARWLAEFAPYLVSLSKSSPLLEKLVKAGWDQHGGVYLTSKEPFETILAHLRRLL